MANPGYHIYLFEFHVKLYYRIRIPKSSAAGLQPGAYRVQADTELFSIHLYLLLNKNMLTGKSVGMPFVNTFTDTYVQSSDNRNLT